MHRASKSAKYTKISHPNVCPLCLKTKYVYTISYLNYYSTVIIKEYASATSPEP